MASCKYCKHYPMCGFSKYTKTPEKCLDFWDVSDVAQVVRCKDCKNWQPIDEHIPHMECQIFCGAYERGYPTNADDFCSYGEMRN